MKALNYPTRERSLPLDLLARGRGGVRYDPGP